MSLFKNIFTELLASFNLKSEDFITHDIMSRSAFEEINKFFYRIETQLNNPAFTSKRKQWAYDLTLKHCRRVALYALPVAQAGLLSAKESAVITVAGLLHDIDKFYWPVKLLDTPPLELPKDDYTRIMEHTVASAVCVEMITKKNIAPEILTIIKQHHENFGGSGYPERLSGAAISQGARIIRIVDSYDTMTSPRPYKTAVSTYGEALSSLKRRSNSTYDPKFVGLFEQALTEEKIKSLKDVGDSSGFRRMV
jgi:putative nucleotidyltransferase with HDIG domain